VKSGGTGAGLRWRRSLLAHGFAFGVLAICILLLRWPPERAGFYPACPIFSYLHVLCPGCGATRAAAALLRGQLREALHWNALFVAASPGGVGYAALSYARALQGSPFRWPRLPSRFAYEMLGITLLFGLARNVWTPGW
jgi:hypothetical protein